MNEDEKTNSENDSEYPKTIIQDSEKYSSPTSSEATETPVTIQQTVPIENNPVQATHDPATTNPRFTVPAHTPEKPNVITPGQMILQWLTYAFWGWTVLALSGLTASVLASFIGEADTGEFTPYAIAAVLVLLPISYVTDYFYSKSEQEKKTGISMAIMVIHAVLFALIGIGSLILAVVMLVSIFTTAGDATAAEVTLYSSLIIAIYYLATFLRTLNPPTLPFIKRYYKLFMLITVGLIALLGVVGPVAKERKSRNDKLIVASISTVQSDINKYARANNNLPESLDDLNLDGDAKKLVEQNLIAYKPQGELYEQYSSSYRQNSATYKYELCANYKYKSGNYTSSYDNNSSMTSEGYSTSVYPYSHPAGEVCYKLKTTSY